MKKVKSIAISALFGLMAVPAAASTAFVSDEKKMHEFRLCVSSGAVNPEHWMRAFQMVNMTAQIKSGQCSPYRHDIHPLGAIFLDNPSWIVPQVLDARVTNELKKYTIRIDSVSRGEQCSVIPVLRQLSVSGAIVDDTTGGTAQTINFNSCVLG